ncbi:MAG: nucleotidyltransferase domain-containing protein [Bacteroidales bacterium]
MNKLFGLSTQDIEKIRRVFSSYPQVQEVIIYGSRAMSTEKPSSDIDFSLVGEGIDLSVKFSIENDLDELLLPYKIDLCIFNKIKDEDFLNHIKKHGEVFYAKNN